MLKVIVVTNKTHVLGELVDSEQTPYGPVHVVRGTDGAELEIPAKEGVTILSIKRTRREYVR